MSAKAADTPQAFASPPKHTSQAGIYNKPDRRKRKGRIVATLWRTPPSIENSKVMLWPLTPGVRWFGHRDRSEQWDNHP
jgi:hypothetical protein